MLMLWEDAFAGRSVISVDARIRHISSYLQTQSYFSWGSDDKLLESLHSWGRIGLPK